ncbi:MAG: hypothetical protein M3319_09065 [Actinomycetota bacterium]|nr:hypothetical protein [Actinomycetota bacterium]
MIASGGNRNPAKLDRGAGGREWRRRINTAWPSPSSVYATVPTNVPEGSGTVDVTVEGTGDKSNSVSFTYLKVH